MVIFPKKLSEIIFQICRWQTKKERSRLDCANEKRVLMDITATNAEYFDKLGASTMRAAEDQARADPGKAQGAGMTGDGSKINPWFKKSHLVTNECGTAVYGILSEKFRRHKSTVFSK